MLYCCSLPAMFLSSSRVRCLSRRFVLVDYCLCSCKLILERQIWIVQRTNRSQAWLEPYMSGNRLHENSASILHLETAPRNLRIRNVSRSGYHTHVCAPSLSYSMYQPLTTNAEHSTLPESRAVASPTSICPLAFQAHLEDYLLISFSNSTDEPVSQDGAGSSSSKVY